MAYIIISVILLLLALFLTAKEIVVLVNLFRHLKEKNVRRVIVHPFIYLRIPIVIFFVWLSVSLVSTANSIDKWLTEIDDYGVERFADGFAADREERFGIKINDPLQYTTDTLEDYRQDMYSKYMLGAMFGVISVFGVLKFHVYFTIVTDNGVLSRNLKGGEIPIYVKRGGGKLIICYKDLLGAEQELRKIPDDPKNMEALGKFIISEEAEKTEEKEENADL